MKNCQFLLKRLQKTVKSRRSLSLHLLHVSIASVADVKTRLSSETCGSCSACVRKARALQIQSFVTYQARVVTTNKMLIFISKRTIKWETENNVIYKILHFARSVSLIPLTFNQHNSLPRVRSPPLLQPERVLLSGCFFNLTALNSETSV